MKLVEPEASVPVLETVPPAGESPAPEASMPVFVQDGVPVLSQREADEIVTYALDPITSANTTGLKSVLLGIIGPYENIVTEYRYMNSNNQYYSYLGSLAVFLVLLFSVFRIGGNLLWKK